MGEALPALHAEGGAYHCGAGAWSVHQCLSTEICLFWMDHLARAGAALHWTWHFFPLFLFFIIPLEPFLRLAAAGASIWSVLFPVLNY